MYWFTSDTHAYHNNIIKYSNRPFDSVEEMNQTMIDNINEEVAAQDTLVHLGDVCFGSLEKLKDFRNRINCNNIILIYGNHDQTIRKDDRAKKLFSEIHEFYEGKFEGQRITLCHYAMRVWNKSHYGAWHLYGHSHGSLPDDPKSLSIDIGVDCHNFFPLCVEEISKIMEKKTWEPVDHHR